MLMNDMNRSTAVNKHVITKSLRVFIHGDDLHSDGNVMMIMMVMIMNDDHVDNE